MTTSIECARCLTTTAPMPRAPMPGPLGEEILARTCDACWAEWQNMEVMVINELRLNFMDPKAQDILAQHLREFLQLGGGKDNLPKLEQGTGDGSS